MDKIKLQEDYGTLSETIHALNEIGYTLDFNVRDNCLVCQKPIFSCLHKIFKLINFIVLKGCPTRKIKPYYTPFLPISLRYEDCWSIVLGWMLMNILQN